VHAQKVNLHHFHGRPLHRHLLRRNRCAQRMRPSAKGRRATTPQGIGRGRQPRDNYNTPKREGDSVKYSETSEYISRNSCGSGRNSTAWDSGNRSASVGGAYRGGHPGDDGHELLGLDAPHTEVQLGHVARRRQGPQQEGHLGGFGRAHGNGQQGAAQRERERAPVRKQEIDQGRPVEVQRVSECEGTARVERPASEFTGPLSSSPAPSVHGLPGSAGRRPLP
jgi:hypothetical protein